MKLICRTDRGKFSQNRSIITVLAIAPELGAYPMRIDPSRPNRIEDLPHLAPAVSAPARKSVSAGTGDLELLQLDDLKNLLLQLAQLPEERAELLPTIHQRLAEGYYDSPEAKQALADRLAETLSSGQESLFDDISPPSS